MIETAKLRKDIRATVKSLDRDSVRYLVTTYYQIQDFRIAAAARTRELTKKGNSAEFFDYISTELQSLEKEIKAALEVFALSQSIGAWSMDIMGIGPVLAAGLIAHIDIEQAPTVGHIWSFAGLDPTAVWGAGQKRPWNAELKTLCWKIGESFVKVSNKEKDIYGKLYKERKEQEIAKNEAGLFADQAAKILTGKKWREDAAARKYLEAGKLPPAHIQARAKRYAVKIFLSHWHHMMWWYTYGTQPPKPFALAHLDHVHMIPVPNDAAPAVH